jgi:small subunit ribosomal protein S1
MVDTPTQQDQPEQPSQEPEAHVTTGQTATIEEATVKAGDTGVAVEDREYTQEQRDRQARNLGIKPELFEEDEYTFDEYEEMLAMYEETLKEIEEGEIVRARVIRVTDNAVILDVGFKSEGSVPKDEFTDPDSLESGEEVEVFLERLEDEEGRVVLSKKKADFLRVWDKIKQAHEEDDEVPGILKRKIKGGVTVDLMGVEAFLPGSQIALRRVPNVDDLIGNKYSFKIIKLNKRRRNIVVSRRVILEEERENKKKYLVKELMVGQVREGVIKNVTDFGAFIDLGGLDGLLHITDMSWGRVGHPSEIVDIGDSIDVKVLDIDWDRERISLGLKQLLPYPWKDVAGKYPVGSRVIGRVVSITNYGAFVELEKGVEGLVHVSEMSWTRNIKHPSQIVSIGDELEAVVLKVDRDDEKISLGMKQIEEDPWLALPVKYPTGTKVSGVVRNLTSFGAFVEIEVGIDGLIHISDMSWTRRIQHPSEVLRKGEEVEVMVLGVDAENKRISLGLKQMQDDPWYTLVDQYSPGVETSGTVVRLLDDGVVVDLGNDVEGFVPLSQLPGDVKEPGEAVAEGQKMDLSVMESDAVNRRIVLAVMAIHPLDESAVRPAPATELDEAEEAEDSEVEEIDGAEAHREATEAAEAEAEAPEAEAPEAPEAEAPEAPEAAAPEPVEAEAPEAVDVEASEAPEVDAAEAPAAEAPEAPAAEAPEAVEAEADEEPIDAAAAAAPEVTDEAEAAAESEDTGEPEESEEPEPK